jgi:hypothetical protein
MNFLLLSGALQSPHTQIFTSVLRQKVYAALDAVPPVRDAPRWILTEDAEAAGTIYSDIMSYLLRKAGKQVVLAGAMTPHATKEFINKASPQGVCIIAGGENAGDTLQNMLGALPENRISPGNTLVLAPGKTLDFVNNPHIPGIVILTNLQEAFDYLLNT